MKAIVCKEFGPIDDLELTEVPDPKAGKGQIVITVKAAGVNYPDGLLVQGLYQMKPERPFTPGLEVAGVVAEVGEGVEGFAVGDRVAAKGGLGGYAEKIAMPASQCFPLPDDMDDADACALMVAYGTSHHALKQRAALRTGETLVVFGASGATGIAAVQIGKIMGARVIGVASSEEKRALATAAGADEVIGYDTLRDDIKRLTRGKGADVVFDVVGGEAFNAASRFMARKGRLLVIGFASGDIPTLPVNLTLVKEYAVVGVFWGNFTMYEADTYAANMEELVGWYSAGKVKPLIEGRYPLADAPAVLKRVLGRGATGKIVLVP
jgi:NADPH2:quinone reductase